MPPHGRPTWWTGTLSSEPPTSASVVFKPNANRTMPPTIGRWRYEYASLASTARLPRRFGQSRLGHVDDPIEIRPPQACGDRDPQHRHVQDAEGSSEPPFRLRPAQSWPRGSGSRAQGQLCGWSRSSLGYGAPFHDWPSRRLVSLITTWIGENTRQFRPRAPSEEVRHSVGGTWVLSRRRGRSGAVTPAAPRLRSRLRFPVTADA